MLRRMTHALREQNWATIVIEFVERLQRDFRSIDARLAESVTRWQQKTAAPVRLLANLEAFQRQGAWPRTHADILRDLNDTLVDLAQLTSDPGLKVALNMYASSCSNPLQVVLLQQEKALAVAALLEAGAKRREGTQP